MQAEYPKKIPTPFWDKVHIEYPVRKHPGTGVSSEAIGRQWRDQPEVLRRLKEPVEQLKDYMRDYNVTKQLTRSQTANDYGFKQPETKRFNKHTSSTENLYIYPQSRRIADRPPQCSAHGTTEMKSSYKVPCTPPTLVTDKDQFKHPASLHYIEPPAEQSWHTELEPLETTHEGFEKYLDPYLTTSRLYHRPYTAEQLERPSCSKDIVTYYTYSDIPWTRTPKQKYDEWKLPPSRPKSMYDREKFKEDFREIRTHNKPFWVPGTFRTESRDNYIAQTTRPESRIHNYEEDVRSLYQTSIAHLGTNAPEEYSTVLRKYRSENTQYGLRKPLCSVIDQFVEKNKRSQNLGQ